MAGQNLPNHLEPFSHGGGGAGGQFSSGVKTFFRVSGAFLNCISPNILNTHKSRAISVLPFTTGHRKWGKMEKMGGGDSVPRSTEAKFFFSVRR